MFSALTAKTPSKILIHRLTPKTYFLARLVHHIQIKGATAEAEVAIGAEATARKENGTASSTRRMMIIV
jgi:hypothetical protein